MTQPRTEEQDKYDHSDHATTHVEPEDVHPPSHAKIDDAVERRGNQRHPAKGSTPDSLRDPDR